MNRLSTILNFLGNVLGANPDTLSTTSKTIVGAVNEEYSRLSGVDTRLTTAEATLASVQERQTDYVVAQIFSHDNVNVPANGISDQQTFDVLKEGYEPKIIQVSLANASADGKNVSSCCCYNQNLNGNTVSIRVGNNGDAAAKVYIKLTVLYVKGTTEV